MARSTLAAVLGAVVASLVSASSASGAYLIREGEVAKSESFDSGQACEPAAVALRLPPSAYRIRVDNGPRAGERLYGPGATDEMVGRVTGRSVRPEGENEILWGAAPLPGGCKPRYGDPVDIDDEGNDVYGPPEYWSWRSEEYDFSARYLVRQRVRLSRRSAASLASTALSRRFGASYNYAEGYPRCRRPRRNRARCSITFWQGDTAWVGRVVVRVGTTRNHRKLRWGYRLNVLHINEYCLVVNHGSRAECTDRIRKARRGLKVPGGRL